MSKITEEELKDLRDQEVKKNSIKLDLGTLDVQRHALLHAFAQVQDEQNKTTTTLEEKYGKVNVNLDDGSYEPIAEEVEEGQ
jgi:hypothetical protein